MITKPSVPSPSEKTVPRILDKGFSELITKPLQQIGDITRGVEVGEVFHLLFTLSVGSVTIQPPKC